MIFVPCHPCAGRLQNDEEEEGSKEEVKEEKGSKAEVKGKDEKKKLGLSRQVSVAARMFSAHAMLEQVVDYKGEAMCALCISIGATFCRCVGGMPPCIGYVKLYATQFEGIALTQMH